MEEVEIYSFDNKDYVLVTKIDSYLYLSNEKDPRDMMIRKEDINDPDLLLPLEDDELDLFSSYFCKTWSRS